VSRTKKRPGPVGNRRRGAKRVGGQHDQPKLAIYADPQQGPFDARDAPPWPRGTLVRLHDTATGRPLQDYARVLGHRPDATERARFEYRLEPSEGGPPFACSCCGQIGYISAADLAPVAL